MVRTFNTAPARTNHDRVFESNPHLQERIVNYRDNNDPISSLLAQNYYGNMYDFESTASSPLAAHKMDTIMQTIPKSVQSMIVGTTSEGSKEANQLLETVQCAMKCYRCRVKGQWFSDLRQGSANLQALEGIHDKLTKAIQSRHYDEAIKLLDDVRYQLDGKKSKQLVDDLKKDINDVKNGKEQAQQQQAARTNFR